MVPTAIGGLINFFIAFLIIGSGRKPRHGRTKKQDSNHVGTSRELGCLFERYGPKNEVRSARRTSPR